MPIQLSGYRTAHNRHTNKIKIVPSPKRISVAPDGLVVAMVFSDECICFLQLYVNVLKHFYLRYSLPRQPFAFTGSPLAQSSGTVIRSVTSASEPKPCFT